MVNKIKIVLSVLIALSSITFVIGYGFHYPYEIWPGTFPADYEFNGSVDFTDATISGIDESDPVFNAWDKSTGINITESQISDLSHTVDTNAATLCANGQFLNGDGTCDAVTNGDITGVTAGNQLSGGGTSGTVTLDVQEGSGSGLDADLLDGQHGSAFAISSHDHYYLDGGIISDLNSVPNDADRLIYQRYSSSATNKPYSNNNANGVLTLTSHSGPYGKQIAFGDSNDLYIRKITNNAFGTWFKLFHTGNDGSGSGLSADTLDGLSSASFLRSDADDVTSGRIQISGGSNGNAYSQAPLEILENWNSGAGEGPHISFHYGGAVASQIGFMKGDASGDIAILNNPGSGYETLRVRDLKVGTTQFIDGSRNILNGGTATFSGLTLSNGVYNHHPTSSYDKIRVWNSASYTIGMASGQSYGGLNDYAMTFTMNNDADRGFLWRDSSDATSDGAMSLTTGGILTVKSRVTSGAFYYSSDKRLKKNIKVVDSPLDKLKRLKGVTFDWRENNESSIGFVAQDVEEVFPELVNTNNKSGMKSVQYGNIVAVSVEAIKEQQNEIEELKTQNDELKQDYIEILKRVKTLENNN